MMIRAEVQAEIDATRTAMARLRASVMGLVPKAVPGTPLDVSEATAAARLCAFRTSRNLTQRAFAKVIGVSQGYIGNIEAGRSEPSREFTRKLAETYGLSADWLLFGRARA